MVFVLYKKWVIKQNCLTNKKGGAYVTDDKKKLFTGSCR